MQYVSEVVSDVIFLGSGSSAGTPLTRCILQKDRECEVCQSALDTSSRNNRGNPSLLVRYKAGDGEHNILIDCGKTFQTSVLKVFPEFHIDRIDSILLTHEHADAMAGLDNIREIQLLSQPFSEWTVNSIIPLYADHQTLSSVREKMGYCLVDPTRPSPVTTVSRCAPKTITGFQPFTTGGLTITPLPVWHGEGYTCMGYMFGNHDRVVYLSDVSEVPPETEAVIMSTPVALLVVDSLTYDMPRPTHWCALQALDFIRKVRPRQALLTGISCHMDHDATNATLRELNASEGIDVQLSYDGLSVQLRL